MTSIYIKPDSTKEEVEAVINEAVKGISGV